MIVVLGGRLLPEWMPRSRFTIAASFLAGVDEVLLLTDHGHVHSVCLKAVAEQPALDPL